MLSRKGQAEDALIVDAGSGELDGSRQFDAVFVEEWQRSHDAVIA
ncbi:MAG: hypothetical protein WBD27_10515 [Pyrinomonadaceae bacterium]